MTELTHIQPADLGEADRALKTKHPDRVAVLDHDLAELVRRFNVGTGSTVLDWEYLLFIARKSG